MLNIRDKTELNILGFTNKQIEVIEVINNFMAADMGIRDNGNYMLKCQKTSIESIYKISRPTIGRAFDNLIKYNLIRVYTFNKGKKFTDIWQIIVINLSRWELIYNNQFNEIKKPPTEDNIFNISKEVYISPKYITYAKMKQLKEEKNPIEEPQERETSQIDNSQILNLILEKLNSLEEMIANIEAIINNNSINNNTIIEDTINKDNIVKVRDYQIINSDGSVIDYKNNELKEGVSGKASGKVEKVSGKCPHIELIRNQLYRINYIKNKINSSSVIYDIKNKKNNLKKNKTLKIYGLTFNKVSFNLDSQLINNNFIFNTDTIYSNAVGKPLEIWESKTSSKAAQIEYAKPTELQLPNSWNLEPQIPIDMVEKEKEANKELLKVTRKLYHNILDNNNSLNIYKKLQMGVREFLYNHRGNPLAAANIDMYYKLDKLWYIAYLMYKTGDLDKMLQKMPLAPEFISYDKKAGLIITYNPSRENNPNYHKDIYENGFNIKRFLLELRKEEDLEYQSNLDEKTTFNLYNTEKHIKYMLKKRVLLTLCYIGLKYLQKPTKAHPNLTFGRNNFYYSNGKWFYTDVTAAILKIPRPTFIKQLLLDYVNAIGYYKHKEFIKDIEKGCSLKGFTFTVNTPRISYNETRVATNQQLIKRIYLKMFEGQEGLNLTTKGLGKISNKKFYWSRFFDKKAYMSLFGLEPCGDGYSLKLPKSAIKCVKRGCYWTNKLKYDYELFLLRYKVYDDPNINISSPKLKLLDSAINGKLIVVDNIYEQPHLLYFLLNDEKLISNNKLSTYLGVTDGKKTRMGDINSAFYNNTANFSKEEIENCREFISKYRREVIAISKQICRKEISFNQLVRFCNEMVYNN